MFQGSFRTLRSQHPLARLLVGVVGLIAALILVTLSVFALAALVIGGGLFLLVRSFRSPSQRAPAAAAAAPSTSASGVIEGEFTVVADTTSRDPAAASTR